jgi:hypothetical protein
MTERHRKATDDLADLKREMQKLGEEWGNFGYAFKHPDDYVFDLGNQIIRLGKPDAGLGRPPGQLRSTDVNWENLHKLLADYQTTRQEVKNLVATLHELGIDVA